MCVFSTKPPGTPEICAASNEPYVTVCRACAQFSHFQLHICINALVLWQYNFILIAKLRNYWGWTQNRFAHTIYKTHFCTSLLFSLASFSSETISACLRERVYTFIFIVLCALWHGIQGDGNLFSVSSFCVRCFCIFFFCYCFRSVTAPTPAWKSLTYMLWCLFLKHSQIYF